MEEADLARAMSECLFGGRGEHTAPAWERFVRLAQPVIASGVLRTLSRCGYRDRQIADDLIQDCFRKLCENDCRALRSFRGEGSNALRAYLRVLAVRVTMDFVDSSRTASNNQGIQPESFDDPEARIVAADNSLQRELDRRMMVELIERCLGGKEARERGIFWLYHRHGYSPQAIAEFPGIVLGKGGVETLLYRLTKAVGECVRKLQQFPALAEGDRR